MSKLEEKLTKDNKRMRAAEKRADALTWDINQAKEGKKVRVRGCDWDRTGQDKTRQYKTRQDKTKNQTRLDKNPTKVWVVIFIPPSLRPLHFFF